MNDTEKKEVCKLTDMNTLERNESLTVMNVSYVVVKKTRRSRLLY